MDLRTDHGTDKDLVIKDTLWEKVIQQGHEIKTKENRMRVAVGTTYFAKEQVSIDCLKARVFTHIESMLAWEEYWVMTVYQNLISLMSLKSNFGKKKSRKDKGANLVAREAAFGYPLGRLELLEPFTKSDLWRISTTFTAFSGEKIIAR